MEMTAATVLNDAVSSHIQWKEHLRTAIYRGEQIDAHDAWAEDCCALGAWLHSPQADRYIRLWEFVELRERHRAFHREVAGIVELINIGRREDALRRLEPNSPCSQLVVALNATITRIQRRLERSQT